MKLNKKQVGLIAGVVCVILLLVLLLTMCTGGNAPAAPATTAPAETTLPVTEAAETEETTAATEEAAEATEETTEATEETTEATEPSKPVYTPPAGGNTATQPTVPETVPAAGSEGSPYYEPVGVLPDSFKTVAIPVDSTVYHNLDVGETSILTIEDADAYVIYQDKKYEADENGIVSLTLAAARADAPVLVQIGNKNGEEKVFSLQFSHALGAKENPHILEDEETVADGKWSKELTVSLAPGNEKGYFYKYTAAEAGTLSLAPKSVAPEDAKVEILITIGETTVKRSENIGEAVSAAMAAGDEAMIQVVAIPNEDGTYPELETVLDCTFTYPEGTIKNPICITDMTSVAIENLAGGEKLYYCGENLRGATLEIQSSSAYIENDGVQYPAESGRVKTTVTKEGEVLFAVGNSSNAPKNFELTVTYPKGSRLNPEKITASKFSTRTATTTGEYYYLCTADKDGKMVLSITSGTAGWTYTVTNLTTGETSGIHKSTDEPAATTYTVGAYKGDQLQIVVSSPDDQETVVKFKFRNDAKDASAVSETLLQLGTNELKAVTTATTTVFRFTPGEAGTYIFEADSGTLSYWGSSLEGMANATTEETGTLTWNVTGAEETVLIGVTGTADCKLNIIRSVVYGEDAAPAAYTMSLLENQQIAAMDLTQKHELFLNPATGFYQLGENGPVVLVDLASNAFVNLSAKELYCRVSEENGEKIQETYNVLLQKYIAQAASVQISETATAKLYPLTEDLVYILKNAGAELGWYDSTSAAYLFGAVSDAQADSLWMFPCCIVQEIPAVEAVTETVTASETE